MKHLIIILTTLASGFCMADESSDLAYIVEHQATQIRKALDSKQWTVTHDENSIQIQSNFEIALASRSGPTAGKPHSKSTYTIHLRFAPQMPKEEYLRIAKERAENAAIIAYGAKTKDEYAKARSYLEKHKLPRYSMTDGRGKTHSIYFTNTDSFSNSISPTEHYAKARGVEGIIDSLMWPVSPQP